MVRIGDLSENMKVRARDGEDLGTIIRLEQGSILVEKGTSFFRDYLVPIALASAVRDGDVYLSLTLEELRHEREAGTPGGRITERTIGEESAAFVHEGEEIGAARMRSPDNLREGDVAPPPER